jgi:dynein assembly factor 5
MQKIIDLILLSDFLNSENIEVLEKSLRVITSLIKSAGPLCKPHQNKLFKILLQLSSNPNMR